VIDIKEKYRIIMLKERGRSNRDVEREAGIDRRALAKYWNEYKRQAGMLEGDDARQV
jgi:hypothetical protein